MVPKLDEKAPIGHRPTSKITDVVIIVVVVVVIVLCFVLLFCFFVFCSVTSTYSLSRHVRNVTSRKQTDFSRGNNNFDTSTLRKWVELKGNRHRDGVHLTDYPGIWH